MSVLMDSPAPRRPGRLNAPGGGDLGLEGVR
jgi:hypothetical protein